MRAGVCYLPFWLILNIGFLALDFGLSEIGVGLHRSFLNYPDRINIKLCALEYFQGRLQGRFLRFFVHLFIHFQKFVINMGMNFGYTSTQNWVKYLKGFYSDDGN